MRRSPKRASTRLFSGESLSQIAFPLGGIGTGTVSLGGRGDLRDWEIHNRPAKGKKLPMTFFAVWAKPAGSKGGGVAKILERQLLPPYQSGHGVDRSGLSGVARLEEATFRGEYPFAWIDFKDRELPVRASLEAFTPFVPLHEEDSSYPAAIFQWSFFNPSTKPVDLSLLATMHNPIGKQDIGIKSEIKSLLNQARYEKDLTGLWFTAPGLSERDPNFMTAALATPWADLDVQTNLYSGGWWDSAHILWDDFAADGRLEPNIRSTYGKDAGKSAEPLQPAGFFDLAQAKGGPGVGALALRARLGPKQSVTIPVYIAWHSPYLKSWTDEAIVRTYVARQFRDAWDVARRLQENIQRLTERTREFHRTLFASTLPAPVLDAVSSQASIVRTCTCIRLADGQFYGWEGCSDAAGCCHGSCTHVWNYAQAVAFLFPALERSMRRNEFLDSTDSSGHMDFRTAMPANLKRPKGPACGDGQMGCIIRAYRDWQLSGDDAFLREIWPGLKRALEYAWTEPQGWDSNRDGVMEGCQHNTYDIEFYGPNPLMGAMYLGALEAAARMAGHLGEAETARAYRAIGAKGRKRFEAELWNGEYYIQKVQVLPGLEVPSRLQGPGAGACGADCACHAEPASKKAKIAAQGGLEVKYQFGAGCLSDQLLGQWASHVAGLGYVLDPQRVGQTMESVYRHNFRRVLGSFSNVQRVYALNDESGLLLCSWPHGNRPRLPFVYSDEVWTGIEYQVAAHLIYEGRVDEGLSIVKAVRDRYDGRRRNPWDEAECGHHYARAMSSWSVLLALSGFSYSAVEGRLGFAPRVNAANFRCAFTTGSGWGLYTQRVQAKKFTASIELRDGTLTLRRLELGQKKSGDVRVLLDNKRIPARGVEENGRSAVVLTQAVTLREGNTLNVS